MPDRNGNASIGQFRRYLAVALSGGADSLYSLLALKKAGVEVFGLHALFLPTALRKPDYGQMLHKLEQNCAQLEVPFHLIDCSAVFTEQVITPFVRAYAAGLTPNPCAACNRDLKFGLLWEEAAKLGASGLVTGHYARRADFADSVTSAQASNTMLVDVKPGQQQLCGIRPGLLNGLDASKDQSYFLALTPLEKLQKANFPLGGKQKSAILAELARLGLEVPQKGESQEICFIPGDDYRAFLRSFAAQNSSLYVQTNSPEAVAPDAGSGPALLPGKSVTRYNGSVDSHVWPVDLYGGPGPVALYSDPTRIIGKHQGLWAYTEGQRHGLGIAWSEPLYVLGKDVAANTLLVGVKADFKNQPCFCGSLNFLLPFAEWPQIVLAKTRYRQALRPAIASLIAVSPEAEKPETEKNSAPLSQSPGTSPDASVLSANYLLRLDFLDKSPTPPPAPGQVAAIYAPAREYQNALPEAEPFGDNDFRLLAGGLIVREHLRQDH